MKYIKTKLNNITKEQINLIINYFKRGKVIIYPTDTVYGLGCLATNKKAIKRIFRIKKREKGKPLLILVSNFKMLKDYCFLSREQEEALKKIRAGGRPTSFILKRKKNLPRELTGGRETIAVRLPNLPKSNFLTKILSGVGKPIVSTSLNLSGRKSLDSVNGLDNYFKGEKADLVVDAGQLKAKPSRLIDIRDIKDIRVLRR